MTDATDEPAELREAERLDHLAATCACQQQASEAAAHYRQSLAARERALGPDHIEVADSLVRLAAMTDQCDRNGSEAETIWRRAVAIFDRTYREGFAAKDELFVHAFMSLVGVFGNLAGVAFRRGDLLAAESEYRRIQALITESYGPECRWTPPTLPAFAEVLIRNGHDAEAESLLRRAVSRTPDLDSIDAWVHPECQKLLADLYLKRGEAVEAEPLYRQAIEMMEREQHPSTYWLAAALDGLAGVCRTSGRDAEAALLEVRANKIRVPT